VNVQAIKDILAIASPTAFVLGIIIALVQLRNQTRLRQFDTVTRIFATFGEDSFQRQMSWRTAGRVNATAPRRMLE